MANLRGTPSLNSSEVVDPAFWREDSTRRFLRWEQPVRRYVMIALSVIDTFGGGYGENALHIFCYRRRNMS